MSERLTLSAREARLTFRAGQYTGYTSGFAHGHVQGSLCILPRESAMDFAAYCQRNPKPCPLIGMGGAGDPYLPMLGQDLDIRSDVPCYAVYRDGQLVDEPTDVTHLWRDDLVAFVWGCSFSFEPALMKAGVTLRDASRGDRVAIYRSNIDTVPVGPFRGKTMVTMRPLVPAQAILAIQITSRFPNLHGAPIHIGLPELLGIDDLDTPFIGAQPHVQPDEIPVFWACGVTPRLALHQARLPFCITHKPGCMVVADLLNESMAIQ